MRSRSFNLIRVVVQSHNIAPCEHRNLSSRLANTTANIKNSHRLTDLDPMGKVVFMASKSLEQSLADAKATEVERLRPGFFVEVGGQVVVAVFRIRFWSDVREYVDVRTC